MELEKGVLRSSNIPNKYELIIVASKEARRLNELSRQTGLNLGGKVTNTHALSMRNQSVLTVTNAIELVGITDATIEGTAPTFLKP